MSEIKPDKFIDTIGMKCPMPLIYFKKALSDMQPGQILEVVADDQTTKTTFNSFLKQSGDELVEIVEAEGLIHHFIKKK